MDVKVFCVTATCMTDNLPRTRKGLCWGAMHLVGKPVHTVIQDQKISMHKYEFDDERSRTLFIKRAAAGLDDEELVLFEETVEWRWVPNRAPARS